MKERKSHSMLAAQPMSDSLWQEWMEGHGDDNNKEGISGYNLCPV